MGIIKPITLETADWDSRLGYGAIDDFIAVVDGREDLEGAVFKARELIQLRPEFQNVAVVRNSTTLEESYRAIAGSFCVKERFGSWDYADIIPWPQRSTYLYSETKILRAFGQAAQYKKPWFNRNAVRIIGTDYDEVFSASRKAFPELLSWCARVYNSKNPGSAHFDEPSRPGLNSLLKLPRAFIEDVNEEKFEALPGGVTLTISLAHGGTITCKRQGLHLEMPFYDDPNMVGYQAQDGDILVLRARCWERGFHPSCHLAPITRGALERRFVAVASSVSSFLAPQVRESLGRPRLPSSDPVDACLSEIDKVFTYNNADDVAAFFESIPSEIRAQVMGHQTVQRFPQATLERIMPLLAAA